MRNPDEFPIPKDLETSILILSRLRDIVFISKKHHSQNFLYNTLLIFPEVLIEAHGMDSKEFKTRLEVCYDHFKKLEASVRNS